MRILHAFPTLLLLMATLIFGCGAAGSDDAVAGGGSAAAQEVESNDETDSATKSETAPKQAATQPAQRSGPINTGLEPDADYPIPDLSPPDLLDYINQVAALQPVGNTEQEYISDQVSRARSRLIAADRIILNQQTDNNLMVAAVRAKLDALKLLALLDPKGLGVHFPKFVDALNEGDSPDFARLGRISQFWFEVDRLAYGQVDSPDELVDELKLLIKSDGAGEAEFLAAQDGSFVLNDRGFTDKATQVLKLIGNQFKDNKEVGEEAQDLLQQTEFREKVVAAMRGGKEEILTLFYAIRDKFKDKKNLNVQTLDNTLNAAQVLEFNGHLREASMVFDAIKRAFRKAEDKNLARQAELSVAFAEKRLGVVGKPIEIEGKHLDGQVFNWEKYKGKVVLVDFWASTSSPWLADLPNLKATHDRFHDDGFEIVGVNVDRVRENAFDYLRTDRLPWTTVIDDIAPGLEANPNAVRYGVQAVPFVMLVGRDGKVAEIHVRGPKLSKKVEELISQPASKNARKEAPAPKEKKG